MGIGVSLLFLAIGAVLSFAIEVENSNGVDINMIGTILMIVGAVGVLLSMMFWSSWGGFNGNRRGVEREV